MVSVPGVPTLFPATCQGGCATCQGEVVGWCQAWEVANVPKGHLWAEVVAGCGMGTGGEDQAAEGRWGQLNGTWSWAGTGTGHQARAEVPGQRVRGLRAHPNLKSRLCGASMAVTG